MITHALSDTTGLLPFFSCCSLSHFPPFFPFPLYLCLPTLALCLIFRYISPDIPYYHLVRLFHGVIASDRTYIMALQPSALWGQIAGIPEYFAFSLGVNVFFRTLCYWCIYLPFLGCLPPPAVSSTLCNVRNTSPSAALHKQVVLMCSSHSFILSLLKSRSALLFINCCFTTPSVFPLLLTRLHLLQSKTSFCDFWCGMSNNILCANEGGWQD